MRFLYSFALILLMGSSSLMAQTDSLLHFPQDWLGNWSGNLEIFKSSGKVDQIPMELRLGVTASNDRWSWMIVYHGRSTDERAYELVAKDKANGLYAIDEKNSIVLDAYWLGGTLTSRFSVGKSLLLINYIFDSDVIRFEVFSGNMDDSSQTGDTISDVGDIFNYPIGTLQRAVLVRQN